MLLDVVVKRVPMRVSWSMLFWDPGQHHHGGEPVRGGRMTPKMCMYMSMSVGVTMKSSSTSPLLSTPRAVAVALHSHVGEAVGEHPLSLLVHVLAHHADGRVAVGAAAEAVVMLRTRLGGRIGSDEHERNECERCHGVAHGNTSLGGRTRRRAPGSGWGNPSGLLQVFC